MSVYLKLQKVRNELNKCELKKTGFNKHSKFYYFELGDFLPKVTELCEKHGVCPIIKFGEIAELVIVDVEKEDSMVTFTSPIAEAKLPGSPQPVQNLGATQTYMRRYLYMNAFEISESDAVDSSDNETKKTETKPQTKPEQKKSALSDAQIKRLYTIAKIAGKSEEVIKRWIKEKWNKDSTKDLTRQEYDEICAALEIKKE